MAWGQIIRGATSLWLHLPVPSGHVVGPVNQGGRRVISALAPSFWSIIPHPHEMRLAPAKLAFQKGLKTGFCHRAWGIPWKCRALLNGCIVFKLNTFFCVFFKVFNYFNSRLMILFFNHFEFFVFDCVCCSESHCEISGYINLINKQFTSD